MPTFSLFDAFLILGGTQGFFLAFLLQQRKVANKPAANYLLTLLILVSFLLFAKLCYHSEWMYNYGEIILLPDVILFLFGPCIWLFTRHLLRLTPSEKWNLWRHAIPAFLHIAIANTILGQHLSGHWSFLNQESFYISFLFIEAAAIISLFAYLIASFQLSQEAFFTGQYMGKEATHRFLSTFFRAGILLAFCWSISFVYQIFVFDPVYLMYQIFWFLLVGYVFWLAYKVVLQTTLFDLPLAPPPNRILKAEDEVRLASIMQYLKNEKPFLEPQLKLADLAEATGLARHELSRIINTGKGQTFFDLINTLRINAFIQAYESAEESERSILQLAYQAGFNSKSAFNRAFRKVTGQSPSKYFKEVTI